MSQLVPALMALLTVTALEAAPPAASPPPPGTTEAVFETDSGAFVVRLRADLAPGHVRHFVKTVRSGGFDGTAFHRIVPGGIVQGGDPLTKDPANKARHGTGGLGVLKAEFTETAFTRGVVAAARRPSSIHSGGSQFFICLTDQPALKGQYTVFGEVVEGMDVVDAIGRTPVEGERPISRIQVRRVVLRPPATSQGG